MDAWLKCALLGVTQGLTEFFPVSSSGHLVLLKRMVAFNSPGVVVEVALHLASVIAIIIVLRREIGRLLAAFFGGLARALRGGDWRTNLWREPYARLALLLVLASVPAGCVGMAFEAFIEAQFQSVAAVAASLIVTGCIVWSTRYAPCQAREMGVWRALLVGAAQAVAIMPGISRSGSTITAGMWLGLPREAAARFSFLLFLPAGLGAALLELRKVGEAPDMGALAAGFIASLAVSWFGAAALLRLARRGAFHWFAPYCWAAGATALALHLAGKL